MASVRAGEKADIYVLHDPVLTLHDFEPVIVIVVCGPPPFAPYQSLYFFGSWHDLSTVAVDPHFECPMYKAFWIFFVADPSDIFLSEGQVLLLALLTHIGQLYHCKRITRRTVRVINWNSSKGHPGVLGLPESAFL